MLIDINPKLPLRNKAVTKEYYINKSGFENIGKADYDGYLVVQKDNIQIHFFEFKYLDPKENYGQVYMRTNEIEKGLLYLVDQTWYRPGINLNVDEAIKKIVIKVRTGE